MPIYHGIDGIGPYFRYGHSGKKYHYSKINDRGKEDAYNNAVLQMRAVHARKKFN